MLLTIFAFAAVTMLPYAGAWLVGFNIFENSINFLCFCAFSVRSYNLYIWLGCNTKNNSLSCNTKDNNLLEKENRRRKMKKTQLCKLCNKVKLLESFYFMNKKLGIKDPYRCKDCAKKYRVEVRKERVKTDFDYWKKLASYQNIYQKKRYSEDELYRKAVKLQKKKYYLKKKLEREIEAYKKNPGWKIVTK